jgi:hypothetical protein
MSPVAEAEQSFGRAGSPIEVLRVFAKLGITCFGGPVAHIGYFRDEFVVRRKWIDRSCAKRAPTRAEGLVGGELAHPAKPDLR